jgi:arylsulfatase A-like enzyme
MYEGGIRTPMIAWWPGKIKAGSKTNHISAFWDISPTVREIAGAEPQADTDGISMVPTLLGEGQQKQHKYLYWEFFELGGKRAIRQDHWKLIQYNTNTSLAPVTKLFNLEKDISEEHNLIEQYPEKVIELIKLMDQAHAPAENRRFKLAKERTPEELNKMHQKK